MEAIILGVVPDISDVFGGFLSLGMVDLNRYHCVVVCGAMGTIQNQCISFLQCVKWAFKYQIKSAVTFCMDNHLEPLFM